MAQRRLCGSLAVALVLALGAGGYWYWREHWGRKPEAPAPKAAESPLAPVPVRTAQVQERDYQEFNEFVGTVQSRVTTQMSSRITAHILAIPVHAGLAVKKDQVLVRLDDQDIQSQVKQMEAGLSAAEATMKEAEQNHDRYKDLYKAGASPLQALQNAEANLKTTKAGVEKAKQQIVEARVNLAYTEIRCPFDAIVVERLAEPGDLAAPSRALITIQSPTELRLEAPISESCARRVRTGDPVQVRVDAADVDLRANVTEIVPAVDPKSRSFLVRADLPSLSALQPGMFGRFEFPCGLRKALSVPPSAVRTQGQLDFVYAVEGKRAHLRLVRLGRSREDKVEILSGLSRRDEVVADPPKTLRDGDPVEAAPAAPVAPVAPEKKA